MEKQIKLKIRANLEELRDFYNRLNTEFLKYKWVAEEQYHKIEDRAWIDKTDKTPKNLPNGWCLQHYLPDRNEICPPWNVFGSVPGTPLIDTPMMTGIAKRLQEKVSGTFRFGMTEMAEGKQIGFHVDDHWRIHFPVYSPPGSLWHWQDNVVHLPADGSAWLMKVTEPHAYSNLTGPGMRVHFLCMIKDEDVPNLLELDFEI